MVADLVHQVRPQISSELLLRIILLYMKNMHDPEVSIGIQTMSSKLLLNLIDSILNDGSNEFDRKSIMIQMLSCFCKRFISLNSLIKKLRESSDLADGIDNTEEAKKGFQI